MLVNFLIVGAQKGGTTALAKFLSTHPQICIAPVKEVHFFDYEQNYQGDGSPWLGVPKPLSYPKPQTPHPSPQDRYHSFFPNCDSQLAVGEATPIYMYFPWIAERIQAYNPSMKLIILLRHPVERAYSHYQMERARGWEWLPFPVAIRLEALRLHLAKYNSSERSSLRTHSYGDRGFYSRQIQNLQRYFPKEQMLILLNEDLQNNHNQTLQRVYQFLGVNSNVNLPVPERVLSGDYQPMSQRDRNYLLQKYDREIDAIASLLALNLDRWKI
ncbi:MAG: sulfotransferase domain-containing protein [Pseudanabaena sp. SU_2_4]|nr:sulfotransferase domain-containing protein [Pseudanabaena sp. SU_2_4]